jgi:hypothetical protein
MRNLFTNECLQIGTSRLSDGTIKLEISSDYSGSSRKSQLYVNEERIAKAVEDFWKSIKTKKLLKLQVSFDEIDWYDDEVDVYETPRFNIQRGLKKVKVAHRTHGSVPKDWSVDLVCIFADTTTNTPILEVVKSAVGNFLTSDLEKQFVKELKPFLQKKTNYARVEVDFD